MLLLVLLGFPLCPHNPSSCLCLLGGFHVSLGDALLVIHTTQCLPGLIPIFSKVWQEALEPLLNEKWHHTLPFIHGNDSYAPIQWRESSSLPSTIATNATISNFTLCFSFQCGNFLCSLAHALLANLLCSFHQSFVVGRIRWRSGDWWHVHQPTKPCSSSSTTTNRPHSIHQSPVYFKEATDFGWGVEILLPWTYLVMQFQIRGTSLALLKVFRQC